MDINRNLNQKNYTEGFIKLSPKNLKPWTPWDDFFYVGKTVDNGLLYIHDPVSLLRGSHLWNSCAQYLLDTLDWLQSSAVCIIGNREATNLLKPLQLCRDIASLTIFYRLQHGEYCEEMSRLMPFLLRTTSSGLRCHRFTVEKFHRGRAVWPFIS